MKCQHLNNPNLYLSHAGSAGVLVCLCPTPVCFIMCALYACALQVHSHSRQQAWRVSRQRQQQQQVLMVSVLWGICYTVNAIMQIVFPASIIFT